MPNRAQVDTPAPDLPAAPHAVRNWLEAHVAHDVEREVSLLTEDVVVAADGRLFEGRSGARDWSRSTDDEDRSVLAVSCDTRADTALVTVRLHGERSRSREVTYCFLLRGGLIRGLAVAA